MPEYEITTRRKPGIEFFIHLRLHWRRDRNTVYSVRHMQFGMFPGTKDCATTI